MNSNLIDDLVILESFETYDGVIYRLVKSADNRYQVRKNFTIYFTTADYKKAQETFLRIKRIFTMDGQIKSTL